MTALLGGLLALLLLCRKRKSVSGVGATGISANYKRDFAKRYFKDHFYTLNKVMPVEDFIRLWSNGKAKAMANGVVKLDGKKYKAPSTNNMIRLLDSAVEVEYYGITFKVEPKATQTLDYRWDDGDYTDRGNPSASTIFLHNDPKLNSIVSGIGKTMPYLLQKKTLNDAQRLFMQFDDAREAERVYDLACDVVYEKLQADGIDPFDENNERLVYDALFNAGLSDENGMTDIYENRRIARRELLTYIYDNILPLFPLSKSDMDLFRNNRNVVYENKLLDVTRDFVQKQLDSHRRINEILKS